MKDKNIITILGIETSCDETAASVVSYQKNTKNFKVLSNIIYSQIPLHSEYGGVFPELAARAHTEKILPVINKAITDSKKSTSDIDAIAVTFGPGLVGSLIIGITAAKTLAYLWQKPLIAVNHLHGHIYSNLINPPAGGPKIEYPALGLIVSGGHSLLVQIMEDGSNEILGQTLDDASGEAFDKIGKLLGLDYPGGPALSKCAQSGNKFAYKFKLPLNQKDNFNFSFSGLKTAVLYLTKELGGAENLTQAQKADICASFEYTVVQSLVNKTVRLAKLKKIKYVIIGGGVAANRVLREELETKLKSENIILIKPELSLCGDNAVGIAASGAIQFINQDFANWKTLSFNPIAQMSKSIDVL